MTQRISGPARARTIRAPKTGDESSRARVPAAAKGLLLAMSCASPLAVRAATTHRFNIPELPAREALVAFGQQSGWQVLITSDVGLRLRLGPLSGDMLDEQALLRLLAGTGLGCRYYHEKAVWIQSLARTHNGPTHCASEADLGEVLPQLVVDQEGEGIAVLEEVVIHTGSHLRSVSVSESGSPTWIIDPEDPRWSGASTLADLMHQQLENFNGGPGESTHRAGVETVTNAGLGDGANLRALGAHATLVLMDGERLAPSGTAAAFTDLLNIPLSAIERIEILGEGASAVYGADAVGGVINLIMKKPGNLANSFAEIGSSTDGTQHEGRLGANFGWRTDDSGVLLSAEVYYRDALPADRRAQLSSDLSPWGPKVGSSYSDPGTLLVRGTSYALPHGPQSLPIDFRTLPAGANLSDIYADADALPNQRRESVFASAHQSLFEGVEGFAQGLWTQRDASQQQGGSRAALSIPNNGQSVSHTPAGPDPLGLQYDFDALLGPEDLRATVRTRNLTAGFKFDLAHRWRASTSVSNNLEEENQRILGRADPATLSAAIVSGGFDPFNNTKRESSDIPRTWFEAPVFGMHSELWQWHVDADGPLWDVPGGAINLATGLEYRNQLLRTSSTQGPAYPTYRYDYGRRLYALYGELRIPFIGARNALSGVRKLELTLQSRYEDHSDFGSALTPRFWLTYVPLDSVSIRATYSRSVRAPNLGDLDESQNVSFMADLPNPREPTGVSHVLAWSGGNANLEPERSRSRSVSVQWSPPGVSNLFASIDYFDTVFDHRIQSTGSDGNQIVADLLSNAEYRDILKAPSDPARAQICAHSQFVTPLEDCLKTPVDALVDLRSLNIASLFVRGFDTTINGGIGVGGGWLYSGLSAVYLLEYAEQQTSHARRERLLNTPNEPVNLRVTETLGWRWRGWDLHLTGNYTHGYHDFLSDPSRDIASWTTLDAGVRYSINADPTFWLAGVSLDASVQNLANRWPPQVVNRAEQVGFDPANASVVGRVAQLRVTKKW